MLFSWVMFVWGGYLVRWGVEMVGSIMGRWGVCGFWGGMNFSILCGGWGGLVVVRELVVVRNVHLISLCKFQRGHNGNYSISEK